MTSAKVTSRIEVGQVWRGHVWLGRVWIGQVWLGQVWLGRVWIGQVWIGQVWLGLVDCLAIGPVESGFHITQERESVRGCWTIPKHYPDVKPGRKRILNTKQALEQFNFSCSLSACCGLGCLASGLLAIFQYCCVSFFASLVLSTA
ncbi:MAG: hypothetical protein FVQ82_04120 [Planctomycetes bacterium]|nr:hypothetical protein [Planctomycetota bacterium]